MTDTTNTPSAHRPTPRGTHPTQRNRRGHTTSPFVFPVAKLLGTTGLPTHATATGPSPSRIGTPLLAIEPDTPVTIDAQLTGLGDTVMVDATITAEFTGTCARCLTELNPTLDFTINEVYAAHSDVINSIGATDTDDTDDDSIPLIINDTVDIEQAVIDTVVIELPFSPVCGDYGKQCSSSDDTTPAPDGIAGDENNIPDIRWAGLEKYL